MTSWSKMLVAILPSTSIFRATSPTATFAVVCFCRDGSDSVTDTVTDTATETDTETDTVTDTDTGNREPGTDSDPVTGDRDWKPEPATGTWQPKRVQE